MPHAWLRLADAVGGIDALWKELGVTRMTLWRIANERTKPSLETRRQVEAIAKRERVPSPFRVPVAKQVDTRFLELVGEGLLKGYPLPRATLEEGVRRFSNDQLVHLAETSEDPAVLTAVTFFLERD